MIIAIDFDGTIVTNNFPKIGELMPDVARVMRQLKCDGHTLILNTCRSGQMALDAVNFMLANNIPFDAVNANSPACITQYGSDSRKVYAHCYIDDMNVGGLPSWSEMYELITAKEEAFRERLKSDSGIKK